MPDDTGTANRTIDMDKYRLRTLVERLIELDEVEIHDEPVPLSQLSSIIEATTKAVLFRKAGPEQFEMVAAVSGSRRRLATAFGVDEADVLDEFLKRMATPHPVVEVSPGEAPVQEVVLTGDDADLTRLPFHPQHEFDGGTYITSGIDFAIDPETGLTNMGARRLSLRNRKEAGFNLTAPSDLRQIYLKCVARGERLPVAFTIGAHPLNSLAASARAPGDELSLIGNLRGEPAPVVKCTTSDIRVPADAEAVLEGYFDEHGYREPEGPYGEYMGYYGPMHMDPVFHVTAITMRRDVLHQSFLHGSGRILDHTDSANMMALRSEAAAMRVLKSAVKEPVAVHTKITSGGGQHLRVAIRQRSPGEPRRAISAIFGALMNVKHVFVVDEDVDVFDDQQMDWAMSTRFQADRDLMVQTDMQGMKMDPSLDGRALTAKAGFDMTLPFGKRRGVETWVPRAATFSGTARFQTVRQALESEPMFFAQLMDAVGSQDGRDVSLAVDELRDEGVLVRLEDGQYTLAVGDEAELRRKPGEATQPTGLASPDYRR